MWDPPTPPWAANPPPGQQRHEENYPGTSTSLLGVGIFTIILSVIVVCMRVYARTFSVRGLKADDCESEPPTDIPESLLALLLTDDHAQDLIILATGFLVAFFVISARLTVYGAGTHIWDVYLSDYSPGVLQLIFFAQVIGCLMVSFNKLSVLSLYLVLTPDKRFRVAVYFLMAVVIGFTLAYILIQLLDCHPVEAQWDVFLAVMHPGSCLDSVVQPMLILSIVNILVDTAVVVLPIPMVLPLPLPKRKKTSCLLLFAAGGGLVCIAAIGRTVELAPLLHPRSAELVDVTWLVVPEPNWAFAEGSIGIIAASLPSISPLFERLISKIYGTRNSENDRTDITLDDMSTENGANNARRYHWQHSKDRTLQRRLEDEEMGLRPVSGRSTQGNDLNHTVSENTVSTGPRSDNSHARSGHAGGSAEPGGRAEVASTDFAVAL